MALQSSPDLLLARVAKFALCDDTECSFSRDKHLLVRLDNVEVRRGNAVAISYTWGSFNRRQIVLGHEFDETPVSMELGGEWIVPDLIATFVSITTDKGACWIDQLSILQEDEKIRQALATVPFIYRTFDVVAVMPGRPCECLTQAITLAERAESVVSNDIEYTERILSFYRFFMRRVGYCLNAGSCSSYFDRIWTRQELMYSARINVVWTSKQESKCVYIAERNWAAARINFEDLSPYCAALLASLPHDRPDVYTITRLMSYHTQFMSSGGYALIDYVGRPRGVIAEALLCRFLNGELITSALPDPTQQDDHQALKSFIRQLGLAASSIRSATHERDYVAAIWVDCPRYRLPISYKSIPLAELIQDAFDQLQQNFGVTLPSSAPNGLFEERSGSGLWNPKYYVERVAAQGLKHVYGSLGSSNLQPIPLTGTSGLPLTVLSSGTRALSVTKAANYEDVVSLGVSVLSVKMIHGVLQTIASTWPFEVIERWSNDFADRVSTGVSGSASERDRFLFEQQILSKNSFSEGARSLSSTDLHEDRIQNIEGIDHHAIFYHMVTTVLGLDENICRQHGLKLILTPKIVGLSRQEVSGEFSLQNGDEPALESIITIGLEDSEDDGAKRLVEAERIASDGDVPKYRAFAIWVPSTALKESDIGAVVREGGTDAILD